MRQEHSESLPLTIRVERDASGLNTLKALFAKLGKEFPNRKYNDSLKHFSDDDFRGMSTYVAQVGNTVAGAFAGVSSDKKFEGHVLLVDPGFANRKIGQKLVEEIMQTHSECELDPVPLGRNPSGGDREERKEALIRYYKALGFLLKRDGKMLRTV